MNKEKLERVLGVCKSMRGLPSDLSRVAGLSEMLMKVVEALLEDEDKQEPWAYKGMPVLVWNDNPERKKYKAFLVEVLEEGVGALEASCTAIIDSAGTNLLKWANWEPNWEHPDMWRPYDIYSLQPDAKREGCIYLQSGRVVCGKFQRLLYEFDKTRIVAYRYAPQPPQIL